ncbi:MAG: hypothetical protein D6760_00160 [Deltaproteobacteria bacterium]|nr:MAG: hypothetical protein D6760_00160 [Deltaproteobacteria bacterium]
MDTEARRSTVAGPLERLWRALLVCLGVWGLVHAAGGAAADQAAFSVAAREFRLVDDSGVARALWRVRDGAVTLTILSSDGKASDEYTFSGGRIFSGLAAERRRAIAPSECSCRGTAQSGSTGRARSSGTERVRSSPAEGAGERRGSEPAGKPKEDEDSSFDWVD